MNALVAGPLQGVRIIDMTVELIGPYATQMMGDLGADVIKIEPPRGDGRRSQGPSRHALMASQFLHTNRSKRSVAVDLKKPAGRDIVLKLCATADVFVYNSRRDAMRRLGLTYESVSAANPAIIYCGASGFGEEGPYAGRPAYDEIIQGLAAIPALQARLNGSRPTYLPFTFGDRAGALVMVNAILAALLARGSTGRGQAVELSMFHAIADFVLSEHMWGRTFDPPVAGMGMKHVFDRRPARTRDGYISCILASDEQVARFWDMVGRGEMKSDARFDSREKRNKYSKQFHEAVDGELTKRTTAEWLEAFERADLPAMPVQTLDELVEDPHLREVGFFRTVSHPTEGALVMMDPPTRWSKSRPVNTRHAPLLGEHTVEVLLEAGYARSDIDAYIDSRQIFAACRPEERIEESERMTQPREG